MTGKHQIDKSRIAPLVVSALFILAALLNIVAAAMNGQVVFYAVGALMFGVGLIFFAMSRAKANPK